MILELETMFGVKSKGKVFYVSGLFYFIVREMLKSYIAIEPKTWYCKNFQYPFYPLYF